MKDIFRIIAIVAGLSCAGLVAQEKESTDPAPVAKDADLAVAKTAEKGAAPATNALPALELKVTKIFSQGNLYASMVSINTG
jgi:hypothetical protein